MSDIIAIKFLSKRCLEISFLHQRVKYCNFFAKKLVDSNLYYDILSCFINDFLKNARNNLNFSNWLFLNHFFDELKTDLMISNCFYHLFHCPRSIFAKSKCVLCSRQYVLTQITKPKNFDDLDKFNFVSFFKEYIPKDCVVCEKFKPLLFYKSYDELVTIMSDGKRCLTKFVVQTPFKLIKGFLEVFLRILMNYCYRFLEYLPFYQEADFAEKYVVFILKFLSNILGKIDFSVFVHIFSENSYNFDILKIINKNFIGYCSEKYASKV